MAQRRGIMEKERIEFMVDFVDERFNKHPLLVVRKSNRDGVKRVVRYGNMEFPSMMKARAYINQSFNKKEAK